MTPRVYAFLFVLLHVVVTALLLGAVVGSLLAPLVGGAQNNDALVVVSCVAALPAVIGLLVLTWKQCTSPELSFWDGLCLISASLMTGCANITMLYLFPVLEVAFLLAAAHSVLGLRLGSEYSQQKWREIVAWFERNGVRRGA